MTHRAEQGDQLLPTNNARPETSAHATSGRKAQTGRPRVILLANLDGGFGLPALRALVKLRDSGAIDLAAIVDTAPASFAKPEARLKRFALEIFRHGRIQQTVGTFAKQRGVSCAVPPGGNLNSPEALRLITSFGAKYAFVFGCDQILRLPLLSSGALFINYHNSFLPEYRGVGATAWPLLEGAAESGFTWHTIDDEAIDEGRVVVQQRVPLTPSMTAVDLSSVLNQAAADALPGVLEVLEQGAPLPHLPKGTAYYPRKRLMSVLKANLRGSPEDLVRHAHVLGNVQVHFGGLVLRLQSVQSAGRPNVLIPATSVRVPVGDGWVQVGRINYLPAIIWLPVLRAMLATRQEVELRAKRSQSE